MLKTLKMDECEDVRRELSEFHVEGLDVPGANCPKEKPEMKEADKIAGSEEPPIAPAEQEQESPKTEEKKESEEGNNGSKEEDPENQASEEKTGDPLSS